MKSIDRNETTTIEELPQTGTQQHRSGVDSQDKSNGNGKNDPNTLAVPGRSKTKTRIALLAFALLVGAASAVYYFRFVAPYESTDNAFIEGNVIPMASQVPGRVAELLVKDNQAVKQGDVILKIDPRDYEASLAQARADLAAAQQPSGSSEGAGESQRSQSRAGAGGSGCRRRGKSARGGRSQALRIRGKPGGFQERV